MLMPIKTPFAKWLDNQYLEWQRREGERRTVLEFADYLDVNRSLLSYWMNGSRIPSEENMIKIALKLGFEIYDVLKMDRPNILYLYAARNWEKLPTSMQRKLAETIAKYTTEPIPDEVTENLPSKNK